MNQTRIQSEDIKDKRVVKKVLISAIDKFDAVVIAIKKSKDVSKLIIIK